MVDRNASFRKCVREVDLTISMSGTDQDANDKMYKDLCENYKTVQMLW